MMVMAMPPVAMMGMVGDVIAHDRAADTADHRANGAGDHGAAYRAGRRAAHHALFGRLSSRRAGQGQHGAARHK